MKFNHVVCGGTFDHLHDGHKKLLQACFKEGKRVSIGITVGAMTRHKLYSHSIQTYSTRKRNVQRFATDHNNSISIIKLKDIYGSTLTDATIDAIYVTEETVEGAKIINKERIKIGLKPLSIIIIPFELDENGDRISSERIREGIISREGICYFNHLISRDTLYMPESLKRVLRKPLGRVISSPTLLSEATLDIMKKSAIDQSYISHISVGDVITYNLKKWGITPSFSVIDGMTLRKALNKEFIQSILEKERFNAPNKKGTIQKEAVFCLSTIFKSGHKRAIKQLLIEGEEDLLTLVVILLAPLGCHVWYGQMNKGAVDVLVTENKKQTVYNLIRQFT